MTISVVEFSGPNADILQARMNAALALLLNHRIYSVDFFTVFQDLNLNEFRSVIMYDDGGAPITTPYQVTFTMSGSLITATAGAQAFITANPTYFFIVFPVAATPIITSSLVWTFYNTNFANGEANWVGPGGGGGGFGGEIIVTPPAALTVIDSALMTSLKSIEWAFEAVKGTNTYSSFVYANNDGTTPNHNEYGVVLSPGSGGTFDFTTNVDASAGSMRLTITPSTVGWTIHVRRVTELSA